MKTSTEYMPISSVPFSVRWPPTTSVTMKPQRIAIRITGTNAALSVIASRLAAA